MIEKSWSVLLQNRNGYAFGDVAQKDCGLKCFSGYIIKALSR